MSCGLWFVVCINSCVVLQGKFAGIVGLPPQDMPGYAECRGAFQGRVGGAGTDLVNENEGCMGGYSRYGGRVAMGGAVLVQRDWTLLCLDRNLSY